MERYYFLFLLTLVWIIFAVFQDLKKREVANWLNFSLIGFALAYRAFYASLSNDWRFLGFGLLGFGLFFVLANGLYYTKAFGGGDAKLLMGLGIVLPFESYYDLAFISVGFLFVLFSVGALYSLGYSFFLAFGNWKSFRGSFRSELRRYPFLISVAIILGALFLIFLGDFWWGILLGITVMFFPILFIYLRTLDSCCMTRLLSPGELTEGDWLESDVFVKGKKIRKSIHGLSLNDIRKLKNAKKKVLIKQGIPFMPVFLIAWIIMVFFFLVFELDFQRAFSFLF